MYINSTGSSKDGQKYGYDTEAFAIYDTIQYVSPPVHTVAVGTAWGEAAMLLAAGHKVKTYAYSMADSTHVCVGQSSRFTFRQYHAQATSQCFPRTGLRTRNSATRNEKHEETNVGNSCQEY